MTTDLLCLANSAKYGGRCVAGVDVETGEWIRPVSDSEHGELGIEHWHTERAYEPQPLDILSVPLDEPTPEPHQPENWSLADGAWTLQERGLTERSARVLEETLHAGPELFGDRTTHLEYDAIVGSPIDSSLELVNPDAAEVYKTADGKPYVEFGLSGETYDMALTDPEWRSEIVRSRYPAEHYLDEGETPLLTVSLGEKYEKTDACHKLVAAIIPVPAGRFGP